MSNSKKWLVVLLAVLVTVLCGTALAACNSNSVWRKTKNVSGLYDPNNPNGDYPFYFDEGMNPDQFTADEDTYVLTVTSKGGLPLSNVKVTVKRNGTELASARSDENGEIRLAIPAGNYDVSYDEMPEGYFPDEDTVTQLSINSKKITSRLSSAVIEKAIPAGHAFKAGEVMYDFTYYDADGNKAQLKELLEDYKCVLLNFWYVACGPCKVEFPAIARTYDKYKNDVYVVSLNPYSDDSTQDVADYKAAGYLDGPTGNQVNKSFNFFMAKDFQGLYSNHFNTGGYPTNVFIDRYGVIAFIDMGSRTDDTFWDDMFKRLSADDYVQDSTLINDSQGSDEEVPLVPPPADMRMPSDKEMTEAAFDASMLEGGSNQSDTLPFHFYGPSLKNGNSQDDIDNTWPYQIGTDSEGKYIYPGNVGTDNTHAILYTDVTVETDQVLTLEYKLQTAATDYFYIVLNQTINQDLVMSGSTNGEWVKLELFTATRPTNINLNFIFVKDTVGTAKEEFVGIRNIKIANIERNPNLPVDVLTEMAMWNSGSKSWTYNSYYLNSEDGLYHMGDANHQNVNDPIIYFNVYDESAWSEVHLQNYNLESEGLSLLKSVYNFAFYKHNDPKQVYDEEGNPQYNDENKPITKDYISYDENEIIFDAYYMQRFSGFYAPVTEKTVEVLKAFTEKVYNDLGDRYYGSFDKEKTWLELCVYYRAFGAGHDAAGHKDNCLVTQIPVRGLVISFAINIESKTPVTFTAKNDMSTDRNQGIRGLYYSYTAPQDGVYKFTINNVGYYAEDNETHENKFYNGGGDPVIAVWDSAKNAYGGGDPLAFYEGAATDKDVVVYLKQNQEIYLQLSEVVNSTTNIQYDVTITRYVDEDWVKTAAGDGWVGDIVTGKLTYRHVDMGLNTDKIYYHTVTENNDLVFASPIYIDFSIPADFTDKDGKMLSLAAMMNGSLLDFTNQVSEFDGSHGRNLNLLLSSYYNKAQANDNLVEASEDLVKILMELIQFFDDTDISDTGAWTQFAVYYEYYGSDAAWKEMPKD